MTQEPNDEFFDMVDEDEVMDEPVDRRNRWLTIGIVLATILLTIILGITGLRALNSARDDEPYADKTWVMQGTYVDLTPDLQTKSNVAKYSGALPADQQLNEITFKSDLADAKKVKAGEVVDFRGSQTGAVKDDFPEEVDALLAKTGDHQVEVIRTGDVDSMKPITSSSVRNAKIGGWASLIGALVVFAGGLTGAVILNRRSRYYDDDYYEEI